MFSYLFKKYSSRWPMYVINIAVVLVVITYQACSQKYSLNSQSLTLPPKCDTGRCKIGQLNPELDQVRPPTKVLFVVDNSRTMQLSQDYLATGMQTMADGLRGYDADFFIYSTSDLHQDKVDANGNPRVADDKPVISSTPLKTCRWVEMVNGKPVEKSGSVCPKDQATTYSLESINLMNPSIGSDLKFRSSYNEAQLNEASQKLSEGIRDVGVDGSSTETGICSLVRSVYNESANGLFQKGDNAAMVILSDENDFSTPQNCLSRTTQDETFVGKPAEYQSCNPATEKCDQVDYSVTFSSVTEQLPYAEVSMNYKCETLGSTNTCALDGSCETVQYSFENLRNRINYSCVSKVPYTVSFNPAPTYSHTLKYRCDLYEDGIIVGTSSVNSLPLSGSVPSCVNGEEKVCDASALSVANSKCVGKTKLNVSSCKLQCNVGSATIANATYDDQDPSAPDRDLTKTNTQIITNWAQAQYPGFSIKSITRGSAVNTTAQNAWMDNNCSSENIAGDDCVTGSAEANKAQSLCGGKKVASCKKRCAREATRTVSLKNPKTEDTVNYCTNTNTSIKFTPSDRATTYSSIKDFATNTLYASPQTATLASCTRRGEKYVSTTQAAKVNSTSRTECGGSYSSLFDTTSLCKGTNPKQNGITSGSINYSCVDKTKTIEKAPQLIQQYTHSGSVAGENICNKEFKANGVTYSSLKAYFMTKTGRTDTPSACVIMSGKKEVVPAGVVSSAKVNRQWTFPLSMQSGDSKANLQTAFHSRSKELFGENGYFVSAIIRDAVEDQKESYCTPLGADQSLGTKYRSLVEATNSGSSGALRGDITSICSSDYSNALSSVSKWIKETVRRSYYAPEVSGVAEILTVSLIREATGEERVLTFGIDFEVVGNKINFVNPEIDPKGWIIKYVYWEPR